MEVGSLVIQVFLSVIDIMRSFEFTVYGVTVNMWSIFVWILFATFIISLINKFSE